MSGMPRIHIISVVFTDTREMGGPLLSPSSLGTPEAEKRMVRTLMVLEVGTLDDAKTIVESDIYYTNDVVRKIECLLGH